ncbi:SEC14-like protein 2 [Schistocerca americana]|uniref:SEC14-like protein 2 n=1 Tax=Schistocerca americana TaxID=7009 RepID=UPI001F4F9A44|nr:SEC14-like protein 2 [Schistocerca americana]
MAPDALDLTDDQRFSLMKLRRNIADVRQPHHDDHYLLRWLRARDFDADAAEKMLRDSLQWRQRWDADNIQSWEPPEVLKKYYPSGISGFDKDGAPVVVVPFAGLDIWGMLHSVSKRDFIRNTIKYIETFSGIARKQAAVHGQVASQVTVVFDMDNFNLRQYAWRPAGEVVIALIQMYEANYPEILKTCYIINAPKVFAIAFSVVKNFLKEYTLSKIQIIKNDPVKWKAAILSTIPADQLPAYYGGTLTDPDGDPKCPSKINQGGKIPKSYYYKNSEKLAENENYTSAVIKKGDKLKLPFVVAQDGSFLKWGFRTENHDIKFGITCTNEEGIESEEIPIRKVNSHLSEEMGVITCSAPATYTIIFDNSYSYLRSKKISYSVGVVPPVETKEEALTEE